MNQEVFLLQEYSMEQANVPYTNHMIYIYIHGFTETMFGSGNSTLRRWLSGMIFHKQVAQAIGNERFSRWCGLNVPISRANTLIKPDHQYSQNRWKG